MAHHPCRGEPIEARSGDQSDVVVDIERMHFLDPGTGAAIRD
jgi:hypothetical protein